MVTSRKTSFPTVGVGFSLIPSTVPDFHSPEDHLFRLLREIGQRLVYLSQRPQGWDILPEESRNRAIAEVQEEVSQISAMMEPLLMALYFSQAVVEDSEGVRSNAPKVAAIIEALHANFPNLQAISQPKIEQCYIPVDGDNLHREIPELSLDQEFQGWDEDGESRIRSLKQMIEQGECRLTPSNMVVWVDSNLVVGHLKGKMPK